MKNSEYYIVHQSILPEYFEQVIKVRELINDKGYSVSDACKLENISRSTYYKYKDYVFTPNEDTTRGKRAIISLLLKNEKGALHEVLNDLLLVNVNVLSITQSPIINHKASIELTIDTGDMLETIEQLLQRISDMDGVLNVRLVAVE